VNKKEFLIKLDTRGLENEDVQELVECFVAELFDIYQTK
jgi:hypothetical protein